MKTGKFMLITECVACGNKIENPRRRKMYCSESCKNRAYNDRKKQSEESDNTGEAKQVVLYTFDFNEFKEIKCDQTFEVYCFLRKNLSGEPDFMFIKDYINNFDTSKIYNEEKGSIIYQEYIRFLTIFHSGKVRIINNNKKEIE